MEKNTQTLNIPTKKAWIIGTALSFVAAIFPTWFLAKICQLIEKFKEANLFQLSKFFFPIFFIIFFLFFAIFILICKWENNKR